MIKRYICFAEKLSWKDFHYIDYMEMTFMMSMKALFLHEILLNLEDVARQIIIISKPRK